MMNKFMCFMLASVLSLGGYSSTAWAQCETELRAADGEWNDKAGQSVSKSGDVVLVGAQFVNDGSGSAYVFRKSGSSWIEKQELVASDGAPYDAFGSSVGIDGDVIIIGARADGDNGVSSGSAYVFRLTGSNWVQEQKLLASDGEFTDSFGNSVGISGDTVIVAAYNENSSGPGSPGRGAAYVFRYNGTTWVEEEKLLASDGARGDKFGFSVDVSGDVVLVGAKLDQDNGTESGSVYVFRRSGSNWVQEQKLLPSDGAPYVSFGFSVAVSGHLAVVGALWDSDNGVNFGSAYVFRFSPGAPGTWVEETELHGSDSATNDRFGWSVSVGDDVAAVGAPNVGRSYWTLQDGPGAVYVFRKNGSSWVEEQKFLASDGARFDSLGHSVALSVDEIVAGAPGKTWASGSAYVFALSCASVECAVDSDCDDDVPCTVDVCTDGVCSHDGTGCVCEECVTLDADGDGDVDLADWAAVQHCFEGPG